jgi:hypothetical protein
MQCKNDVKWNGKYYDYRKDPTLNSLQQAHIRGEINLYENTEAYTEQWYHKGMKYYPISGTRVKEDLPPIYIQWKDAYRRNYVNNRSR